jgi:pyrroline-5-carboxylate reductase
MYGFIGAGNMATAIIKGMLKSGLAEPERIFYYDIINKNLEATKTKSIEELISGSDIIILAVKPHILPEVLEKNCEALKSKLLISIAAGTPIKKIESFFGAVKPGIVRVMPNVAASIGESMSAICHNAAVSRNDVFEAKKIFESVGEVVETEERLFAAFAAIASASLAFTFRYIDALANAGLKAGFAKTDAIKIAAQAVFGSAKLVLETRELPAVLTDNVTSPGGTTIEGVASLAESAFESAVIKAVDAVINKDLQLQNEN